MIEQRITEYLCAGGLFNPELMDHRKVSDLLRDARDEIELLRAENRELMRIREEGHAKIVALLDKINAA
jgi:hypothetical protein